MSDKFNLTELDLLPQWAKDPMPTHTPREHQDTQENPERRERPERAFRDDRQRERPRGKDRRPDRRSQGPGDGPDRGSRPPPRRDGPRDKSRSEAPRGRGQARPERPPEEVAPDLAVEVSFLPDPHGAESMARQIRTTCLAYPVFDLAKLILRKPERHHIMLNPPAGREPVPLFQSKLDGTVWLKESDAVAFMARKHLDVFYATEKVPCEPPKGNFTALGVCEIDGTVLGPVNHHDYQSQLRQLHQRKFSKMPFESFRSRIQTVRDPGKIEAWKQSQSERIEYVVRQKLHLPKNDSPEAAVTVVAAEAPAPVKETPVETVPVVEVADPTAEADAPVTEANVEAATEAPMETEATDQAMAAETSTEAVEGAASGVVPMEEPTPPVAEEPLRLTAWKDVLDHFAKVHAPEFILRSDRAVLETPEARLESDPIVQQLLRFSWNQEIRFPIKTARLLIGQLGKFGLQFFKWGKGATFVSGIRPKRLDHAIDSVAAGMQSIVEWVRTHPNGKRDLLFESLKSPEPVAAEPPAAVSEATTLGAADGGSVSPVATDLLWLVREGYVIAFSDGTLDLIRHVPKAPEPKAAAMEKVAVVEVRKDPVSEKASLPPPEPPAAENQDSAEAKPEPPAPSEEKAP